MFKRFQRVMKEGDDAGGGGLMQSQADRDAAAAAAAASAVKPEDARKYLTDYVADPAALVTMKDEDVVKYHGKLTAFTQKQIEAAVAKAKTGPAERPKDVPEQFWDDKTKVVNFDAWNKSLNDTRQALKQAQGAKGAPPKTDAEYAYTQPKDLPAHIASDAEDDAIKVLRRASFKAGLSQEQFAAFSDEYLRASGELLPAPVSEADEKKKLGPNADKLIETVYTWGKGLVKDGLLSKDEFEEVFVMGSSAVGIRALNKLREGMGGQSIPTTAVDGSTPSLSEVYAMVGTEKYMEDPAERARVTKLFETLLPEGSAIPVGIGAR